MQAVRLFLRFWYDFIVGDDWTVAAGIVLALAATAAIVRTHLPAWWLLPLAALALLVSSLIREHRRIHR
jgi:hypothetical protein